MSPVSLVFHNEATVSTNIKTSLPQQQQNKFFVVDQQHGDDPLEGHPGNKRPCGCLATAVILQQEQGTDSWIEQLSSNFYFGRTRKDEGRFPDRG